LWPTAKAAAGGHRGFAVCTDLRRRDRIVTYTTFPKQAGPNEKEGLAFDNISPESLRRYAIRWVTTPERAQDPCLLKFIAVCQQSPEAKQILKRMYGDLIEFPW
jgi:D-methionine transport system substrate-binding protein